MVQPRMQVGTQVSKFVSKLVCIREKERQTGQLIGNSKVQGSNSDSNVMEEAISLTEIGSNSYGKEATRQDSRAIQGHTGGEMIEPEMMGHVLIHHNWKEFVFHRGCSFNQKSILCARLIAGGREGRDTRYTVFFTPLNHGVSKKKKSIVVILRNPEKFSTKHDGSTFKTLFMGSIMGEHKTKALRFGKRNRTQSSPTARCHLTVLNVHHILFPEVPGMSSSRLFRVKGARETSVGTLSKRCFEHCSEGAAGNCWRETVRGSKLLQCCE